MKKMLGFLLFYLNLSADFRLRYNIDEITNRLSLPIRPGTNFFSLERILYMLVGCVCSGKTAFAQSPAFAKLFVVSENQIHDALDEIPLFQGKVGSARFFAREVATCYISEQILDHAIRGGFAIISDACNLRKSWRRKILNRAKYFNYDTRLIYAHDGDCIAEADPRTKAIYWQTQYRRFDVPEPGEARSLAYYNPATGELKEALAV